MSNKKQNNHGHILDNIVDVPVQYSQKNVPYWVVQRENILRAVAANTYYGNVFYRR